MEVLALTAMEFEARELVVVLPPHCKRDVDWDEEEGGEEAAPAIVDCIAS